jgi:hypothetical protein
LVACGCIPSERGTLSPGIIATQCKQFRTNTLTSFAVVSHETYSLTTPSVASCTCAKQSSSVPPRTNAAAARLHAQEYTVHCSSSSCHQHRHAAAVLLDENLPRYAGLTRTPVPRYSAPEYSLFWTETLPYCGRAGRCTAARIGWSYCHALCALCLLSTNFPSLHEIYPVVELAHNVIHAIREH